MGRKSIPKAVAVPKNTFDLCGRTGCEFDTSVRHEHGALIVDQLFLVKS
jgi:hypothetical protein